MMCGVKLLKYVLTSFFLMSCASKEQLDVLQKIVELQSTQLEENRNNLQFVLDSIEINNEILLETIEENLDKLVEEQKTNDDSIVVEEYQKLLEENEKMIQNQIKIDNKMLLGAVEYVMLDDINVGYEARIDTGALSSSLSAVNIVDFERNGRQWVQFTVPKTRFFPEQQLEYPVEKKIKIKGENGFRYVINLKLSMGAYSTTTLINLADRRYLRYPLLIGRVFLRDIAVVDISKRYIASSLPRK